MRKTAFMQWVDAEIEQGPAAFRRRVEATLGAMRLEEELVALRKARGLSQAALARRAGVSQPLIARLESGRIQNITLRTLLRYVAVAGGRVRIQIGPEGTR